MIRNDSPKRHSPIARARLLDTCPWCGGAVVLEPYYPLTSLIPGDVHRLTDVEVPEPLRTVPAWVCQTPDCRFRERA